MNLAKALNEAELKKTQNQVEIVHNRFLFSAKQV
jgi:hypothetical protein